MKWGGVVKKWTFPQRRVHYVHYQYFFTLYLLGEVHTHPTHPPPTGRLHISIQTAGLALGGTGLCSYRVRSVDGSCAEHLTVESYTVIYAANSYTYYY